MASEKSNAVFASIHAPRLDWLQTAEPEEVLDPQLPIVDAHLHLWQAPNGYRYYVDEYAQDLKDCGHAVVASIYEECFHHYRPDGPDHLKYVGETEFAVDQATLAREKGLTTSNVAAGIVGHGELTLGAHTRELLESHIAAGDGRFRGIRQVGKWDADAAVRGKYCATQPHFYLRPEFGEGLDMATELGLSFDASVFHPQIPDVTTLARNHPDANIILVHCGSPVGHGPYAGKQEETHAAWLLAIKELATCENVSIKLGGLLINLANFDFSCADVPPSSSVLAELWRPYIEPCIELFGADRCMVSSNFPVEKVGFGYGTVWNMFKRLTAGCSASEKEDIFGGTAKRVYRLT